MLLTALLVVFSVLFLVAGIILLSSAILDEDIEYVPVGIVAVCLGLLLLSMDVSINTSSGSDEWVLKEEAFLVPVSDNCYLLEGETNYIYQEKSPSGTLEPEMVQNEDHTQIEVKTIASTEEPYVLKYERTVGGDEECKYVFYIPQS